MSSGHPWLFQWAKEGKLFCLQPLHYSLWSGIFTSIWNVRVPTGCLWFVATPRDQCKEFRLAEKLATIPLWCVFYAPSVGHYFYDEREPLNKTSKSVNLQDTCIACINPIKNKSICPQQYRFWALHKSSYIYPHKVPPRAMRLSLLYMVLRNREMKWAVWCQPCLLSTGLVCGPEDHSLCQVLVIFIKDTHSKFLKLSHDEWDPTNFSFLVSHRWYAMGLHQPAVYFCSSGL